MKLSDIIETARQKAGVGDVERAAALFEQAVMQIEHSGNVDQFTGILHESIEYFAAERLDTKLIPAVEKLVAYVKPLWEEKDERYLFYLDHLCKAYYRQEAYQQMKNSLLFHLDLLACHVGEASEEYVAYLNYAVGLLNSSGQKELAAQLKRKCVEISIIVDKSPEPPKAAVQERRIYLGLILTRSGLIDSSQFQAHLKIAKQLFLPVGEVLVSAGILSEEQLYYSLQLQAMARAGEISLTQAGELLSLLCKHNLSLEVALKQIGIALNRVEDKNRLGRILVSAGFLVEDELEGALATAAKLHSQLGHYLVITKRVPPTVVARAIELQQMILDGSLSREQAVETLRNYAYSGM